MIQSGGELVLADITPVFARTFYAQPAGLDLSGQFATYAAIYKKQLMVYSLVRKLALATARLPLKVYQRAPDGGREEVRDDPYARLLRHPNPRLNAKHFWEWTVSTLNVYGESMWIKVRNRQNVPVALWPLHPANVYVEREDDGSLVYVAWYGDLRYPEQDVVHFRSYNPLSTLRGLSPLEPLRMTLLNEDAARRATTAFWANGARPATVLSHPKKLTDPKMRERLKAEWDAIHGGVDNFAKTAILEEGMEPKTLSLSSEEAQYIESRKLNREEVCIAYDIPPPVVHILDHATFSNITEQMRSMYRDTMAPRLQLLEADLEHQLRPDFADDSTYAEFLMDEVLRGDFEVRMEANQKAVGSAQLTPNEARALENRPSLPGGDRLYINSTLIPIDEVSSRTSPNPPAEDVAGVKPAVEEVPTTPAILVPRGKPSVQVPKALDVVMGRLGRVADLSDVDAKALVDGLNGEGPMVVAQLEAARHAGQSVQELRDRLRRVLWVKE